MLSFYSALWVTTTLATASLATLTGLIYLTRTATKLNTSRRLIPSPRTTLLPFLSARETAELAYPPNILPGARDVDSPYGVMRAYEWGPEDGSKVLLIHGDTTPGPILGPIAKALVKRGCRVLILDLWGRGYSDAPLDVPHDVRLFGLQILFAIASSPLSWTGSASGGFSIIGFSMGGGITMSFASHFPSLINSLILLAPAGILRRMPDDYKAQYFRYSSLVPASYLRTLVGKIMGVDMKKTPHSETKAKAAVLEEADLHTPRTPKNSDTQTIDVPAAVQWQFDNHQGFVYSFIDSIAHGPLMHQQADWNKTCAIIKGDSSKVPKYIQSCKLFNSKILVIFGQSDGVVVGKEVSEDLSKMLDGSAHVEYKMVPGGHGFPVPSSDEVVKHISAFWKLREV